MFHELEPRQKESSNELGGQVDDNKKTKFNFILTISSCRKDVGAETARHALNIFLNDTTFLLSGCKETIQKKKRKKEKEKWAFLHIAAPFACDSHAVRSKKETEFYGAPGSVGPWNSGAYKKVAALTLKYEMQIEVSVRKLPFCRISRNARGLRSLIRYPLLKKYRRREKNTRTSFEVRF